MNETLKYNLQEINDLVRRRLRSLKAEYEELRKEKEKLRSKVQVLHLNSSKKRVISLPSSTYSLSTKLHSQPLVSCSETTQPQYHTKLQVLRTTEYCKKPKKLRDNDLDND